MCAQDEIDLPAGYIDLINSMALEASVSPRSSELAEVNLSAILGSGFPEIVAYVAVKDEMGHIIEGLTSDDFVVLEFDGEGRQTRLHDFVLEAAVGAKIDLVLAVDTTGSMWSQIELVRRNLDEFVRMLSEWLVDWRLGGVAFGDEVPYREKKPFTSNVEDFRSWIASLAVTGGEDTPENSLGAIVSATDFDYRADAQKVVVLITDAPPHVAGDGGDSETEETYNSAKQALLAQGCSFYYWCNWYWDPPHHYDTLGGESLGDGEFSDLLMSSLAESVVSQYVLQYTTPSPERDGTLREVNVGVSYESTYRQDSGSYTAPLDAVSSSLAGVVRGNDGSPIEGAQVNAVVLLDVSYMPVSFPVVVGVTRTGTDGVFSIELSPELVQRYAQFSVLASHWRYEPAGIWNVAPGIEDLLIQLSESPVLERKQALIDELSDAYPSAEAEAQLLIDRAQADLEADGLTAEEWEAIERLLLSEVAAQAIYGDAKLAAQGVSKSLLSLTVTVVGLINPMERISSWLSNKCPVYLKWVEIPLKHSMRSIKNIISSVYMKGLNYLVEQAAVVLKAETIKHVANILAKFTLEEIGKMASKPVEEIIATLLEDPLLGALFRWPTQADLESAVDAATQVYDGTMFVGQTLDMSRDNVLEIVGNSSDYVYGTSERLEEMLGLADLLGKISAVTGVLAKDEEPTYVDERIFGVLPGMQFFAGFFQGVSMMSKVLQVGVDMGSAVGSLIVMNEVTDYFERGTAAPFGETGWGKIPVSDNRATDVGRGPVNPLLIRKADNAAQTYLGTIWQIISLLGSAPDFEELGPSLEQLAEVGDEVLSEMTVLVGLLLNAAVSASAALLDFDVQYNTLSELDIDFMMAHSLMMTNLMWYVVISSAIDAGEIDPDDTDLEDLRMALLTNMQAAADSLEDLAAWATGLANRLAGHGILSEAFVLIGTSSLPDVVQVGESFAVEITVRNASALSVSGVSVRLQNLAEEGVTALSSSTLPIGTLEAGGEAKVEFVLRVDSADKEVAILSADVFDEMSDVPEFVTTPLPHMLIITLESPLASDFVEIALAETGWHMTSLPGQLCDPCTWTDGQVCGDLACALEDDLDPFFAYRYDAEFGSYYRVPPSEDICYQPGMSAWIYTTEENSTIDAVVTPIAGTLELPLGNGWNQIGNPYAIAISPDAFSIRLGAEEKTLLEAEASEWISATLYAYDTSAGNYTEIPLDTGCLQSWTGVWLRTFIEGCTLVINPMGCAASGPMSRPLSLAEIHERGLELPPLPPELDARTLSIDEVLEALSAVNIPNPIRSEHTTVFKIQGAGSEQVEEIRVDIYNQSGRRVFTQRITAKELAWHTVNNAGELLANGVYLYQVWVKLGEIWYPMEIQKLAVVR